MPRGWPLVRRAPGRMLHNGPIAVLLVLSVALLAGLVAAGPLFGSSTAAGGLERRLATIPQNAAPSLRPAVRITLQDGPPPAAEARIDHLVDSIPYLGSTQTTESADSVELDNRHPTPFLQVGSARRAAVLFFSTRALGSLQVVSGTRGTAGVWLPSGVADSLGVRPGQTITVGKAFGATIPGCPNGPQAPPLSRPVKSPTTTVRVAGTYRTAVDGRLPLGSYFAQHSGELPSDPSGCPTTALLMIGDRATITTAINAVQEDPLWSYEGDLTPAGQTPAHLAAAAAAATRLKLAAAEPGGPVASLLGASSTQSRVDSGLGPIHQQAAADAVDARRQGRGVADAGAVLGFTAVLVALAALVARRRRETELLLGLGTPTWVVVGAGTTELLLPAVLGAAAGWAAACAAFADFGPHRSLDPAAVRSAAVTAALVALATLVGNAVVTLTQVRQVARSLAGKAPSRVGSQWLPLLTGATVLAVVGTFTRDRDQSFEDPLSAILPILVLACGCALVAKAAERIGALVRSRRTASAAAVPPGSQRRHLAADQPRVGALILRGLRRTGVAVTDLVVVLGIGVGILVYGLSSSASVTQAVADKSAALAGAVSTARIPSSYGLGGGPGPAPALGAGTTVVWRSSGVLSPDSQDLDVIAINPRTLVSAATWGSGAALHRARAALALFPDPPAGVSRLGDRATFPIPAMLIGPTGRTAGTTAQASIGTVNFPIRILATETAFPGAVQPTLVVDARSLLPRLSRLDDPSVQPLHSFNSVPTDYDTWVWTRQSPAQLLHLLASKGITPGQSVSLAEARSTPVLTSSRWAATYQVVLGVAAAALAGLAFVVSVDRRVARAASVDLVLRRFGVRSARLLGLRSIELVATAFGALAVLVLPLAVMIALLPRLSEPLTSVPPAMPAQAHGRALLLGAATAAVITALAAAVAARRSAAIVPGEVLRDDG